MAGRDESLLIEKTFPRERLDMYLRDQFPAVSRGTIQRLIEQGHIRVNGQPVKPTHSPRAGEVVTIHWPDATPAEALPEDIPLDVLYEDPDLLVLNKAPGIVVHPAAGNEEGTLVNALLHHCAGQLSGIGGVQRPGIVHRLDKDTSGCLVVAKNDAAHLKLSEQFAGRDVQKIYEAIVCGIVHQDRGDIRAAIARHPSHRKRMAAVEGGRDAWTSFVVRSRSAHATHLDAQIHTGRTHQIRVHFQHMGHPLIGDDTYGKRQNTRITETTRFHAPRQMLHARTIAFTHPTLGKRLTFEAPIPGDFTAALTALGLG